MPWTSSPPSAYWRSSCHREKPVLAAVPASADGRAAEGAIEPGPSALTMEEMTDEMPVAWRIGEARRFWRANRDWGQLSGQNRGDSWGQTLFQVARSWVQKHHEERMDKCSSKKAMPAAGATAARGAAASLGPGAAAGGGGRAGGRFSGEPAEPALPLMGPVKGPTKKPP